MKIPQPIKFKTAQFNTAKTPLNLTCWQPYFGSEELTKSENSPKKDKWPKRAAKATKEGTKKIVRKLTHWQEFKASVKQGKGKAIGDWHHAMDHHSKPQKAIRIAREVVGIPILIAFTFVPGPNPGWFISPTLNSFFRGFMQETKKNSNTPEAIPNSKAPDDPPPPLSEAEEEPHQ